MTTIILFVQAGDGLNGSFLMDNKTDTIEAARSWFGVFFEGMAGSGNLDLNETLYGITFADKSLDELRREFPYLFEDGEWHCGCKEGSAR